MSRNAEILFWTDLPWSWLAAAAGPHLAFIACQAAWRLARGRARPFLAGKVDAIRQWRTLRGRRKTRRDLARDGIAPPHFPIKLGLIADIRNHLRRPGEASSRGD
jgi:hypothetical protein